LSLFSRPAAIASHGESRGHIRARRLIVGS
jgi:hypothetical protein